MTAFPTKKLADIADIYSGYAFKSRDLKEEGIPVIKIKNVNDKKVSKDCDQHFPEELLTSKLEKYFLQDEDVLVAMTGQGSLGRIGKMQNKKSRYLINQRVGIIRPKEKNETEDYLFSVLALDIYEDQLFTIGLGAGQPNVSAKDIGSLDIPFPEINTRKEIGAVRKAYDNLIQNNNRRIAILEDMAQSLYREWFVKFRFPGHEGCQFKDSALGRIPVGWEGCELCDFVDFWNGKKCTKSDDGKFPIYGANGIIGLSDQPRYESGIIIGRVGAYCGAVEYCFDKFWGSDNTIIAKCKSEDNLSYLFLLLKFFNLNSYAGGAAQPLLTQATLTRLPFVLPPKNMIEEFDSIAKTVYKSIDGLIKKNTNLREQRDMLLPKLISGKINI